MLSLNRKHLATFALVAVGSAVALTSLSPSSSANATPSAMRYDIAMDGMSFAFEGPMNAEGAPARGTPFVVEGYIYPANTFTTNGLLSGVLEDGSPEFPSMVVGTWTCRGWHLLDGNALTGAVVVTDQTFDFDLAVPGAQMITTEGIELADFDVPFERVITGGTGRYNGLTGQHTQVYVGNGLNASQGFNTTVVLQPGRAR